MKKVKEYHENGQLSIEYEENKDGEFHGEYKAWYENGQLKCTYRYENGKQVGRSVSYYPNGRVKRKGMYAEGLPHGSVVSYHDTDECIKREECYYEHGKLHDILKQWDDTGKLVRHVKYGNGEVVIDYLAHGTSNDTTHDSEPAHNSEGSLLVISVGYDTVDDAYAAGDVKVVKVSGECSDSDIEAIVSIYGDEVRWMRLDIPIMS